MDNDDRWRMYDIEMLLLEAEQVALELEELIADCFPDPNRPAPSRKVELMPDDEWLNRRLSRRRRRPKRQLHPCRPQFWQKWVRRERSHHRAERLVLRDLVNARDAEDQLDDYVAELVTDIPSVGMTIGNAYFRENIGEYPRTYTVIADVIYPEDVEDIWDDSRDATMPVWRFAGFNSEDEYFQYIDEVASYESRYSEPVQYFD